MSVFHPSLLVIHPEIGNQRSLSPRMSWRRGPMKNRESKCPRRRRTSPGNPAIVLFQGRDIPTQCPRTGHAESDGTEHHGIGQGLGDELFTVLSLLADEGPKSPLSTSPRYRRYCFPSGSSMWYFLSRFWSTCSVTFFSRRKDRRGRTAPERKLERDNDEHRRYKAQSSSDDVLRHHTLQIGNKLPETREKSVPPDGLSGSPLTGAKKRGGAGAPPRPRENYTST